MKMALLDDDAREWWSDDHYLDSDGEPAVSELIRRTNLKDYMQAVPKVGDDDNSFWMYDNDGDEHPPGEDDYDPDECPRAHRSGGVNIQIELHDNVRLAQQIDNMLDDGNLECGKFREHHRNSGEFLWLLSPSWQRVD